MLCFDVYFVSLTLPADVRVLDAAFRSREIRSIKIPRVSSNLRLLS